MATEITDSDLLTAVANGGANAPRSIDNGNGTVLYNPRTGRSRRMSAMTLSFHGVELTAEYLTNNCIGTDACVESVESVQVGNVEIIALLSDLQLGEIAERIETAWDLAPGHEEWA